MACLGQTSPQALQPQQSTLLVMVIIGVIQNQFAKVRFFLREGNQIMLQEHHLRFPTVVLSYLFIFPYRHKNSSTIVYAEPIKGQHTQPQPGVASFEGDVEFVESCCGGKLIIEPFL